MEDNHNYLSDEMLAAFLDGNLTGEELSQVVASIGGDPVAAKILELSPSVDLATEREERGILPIRALAAANPGNLCSFDCEAFILYIADYDIDNWSLLETAKAKNWLREDGTPLHHVGRLLELKGFRVTRKYDACLEDLTEALDRRDRMIVVVDRRLLDGEEASDGAPSFHAIYVTYVSKEGDVSYLDFDTFEEKLIDRSDFMEMWECSGFYMVTASDTPGEYDPQPISVENIDLDADLEDLTEAIAENAHDIWARTRMDEGWTYGPVRDDALKHHPDLVPYAQLPDSEKEYDRLMAMNTLRLVRRLGFDITNRNND